ncbi:hypothetical protein BC829DRAFT_390461 [Chytridium lagenaria]|nr:hypothetical protein BC829DRAFT_390461 [Chytridium lagenaria]
MLQEHHHLFLQQQQQQQQQQHLQQWVYNHYQQQQQQQQYLASAPYPQHHPYQQQILFTQHQTNPYYAIPQSLPISTPFHQPLQESMASLMHPYTFLPATHHRPITDPRVQGRFSNCPSPASNFNIPKLGPPVSPPLSNVPDEDLLLNYPPDDDKEAVDLLNESDMKTESLVVMTTLSSLLDCVEEEGEKDVECRKRKATEDKDDMVEGNVEKERTGKRKSPMTNQSNTLMTTTTTQKISMNTETISTLNPPSKRPRRASTSFSRRSHLASHTVTHTSQKNFICESCNTAFARCHDLHRHRRTKHVVGKAFGCGGCGMGFARKDSLKKHVERHCRGA